MTIGIDNLDNAGWTDVYYNDDLATGDGDGTTEANAWQSFAGMLAGVKEGDRVNMKRTGSPVDLSGGSVTLPAGGNSAGKAILYRGYTSTIGDGGNWQCDMGAQSWGTSANLQIFQDIEILGRVNNTTAHDQTVFYRCVLESDGSADAIDAHELVCIECEIKNTGTFSTSGYVAIDGIGTFIGCILQAPGDEVLDGSLGDSEGLVMFKNVVHSTSSKARDGVRIGLTHAESSSFLFVENSVWGCANGVRVDDLNAARESAILIAGNALAENTNGLTNDEASIHEGLAALNNAMISDTNDFSGWADFDSLAHTTALSGDPFTDAANGDFEPDSTANEGALLRDGGTIGFIGGTGTEKVTSAFNLGADRHGTDDGAEPQALGAGGGGPADVTGLVISHRRIR